MGLYVNVENWFKIEKFWLSIKVKSEFHAKLNQIFGLDPVVKL